MKRYLVFLALFATTALGQSRFGVEEKETIRRTLEFSSGDGTKTFELTNVFGSIRVVGYDGRNVELTANKTIRAESGAELEEAKNEVRLDISDKSSTVRVSVDYPDAGDRRSYNSWSWNNRFRRRHRDYTVAFDFEIRVPRDTAIRLKTVNDGVIKVEKVAGDFDVNHVNGDIDMLEASGSGRAYTVNGRLNVTFADNPKKDSYFGSVNGEIAVTFRPNLSADLRFKSFNGGVYTDFPATALNIPPTGERRNGKFVYKTNGFSGARVGNGGPKIEFDGFNGNVRILRAR